MADNDKLAKKQIRSKNSLDDGYVDCYTNNPKAGRTAAIIEAGYDGDYPRQEAARYHKRLAIRIHEAFTDKIKRLEGAAIANIQSMLEMPIKEIGASNMLATAKAAMDYAGRKAADTLIVKEVKTIDDIDANIERLQNEIAKTEGKELH